MKNKNIFLHFLPLLIGLGCSASAYSIEPSGLGCDGNTHEQHHCLQNHQTRAEKALSDTYQELISLVKNHGDAWAAELREAQEKWLAFRNANWAFYGGYLSGGTGAAVYASACRVKMTRDREKELKAKHAELVGRGYVGTK